MIEKIKAILGSSRFWIATLAWASDYAASVSTVGFSWPELFTQLSKWLGTVVAIGTFDSVAEKFGSKKVV